MKKVRKAWNGGSIEAAMEYARKRNEELIRQGATLCDECGGEGGTILAGVCQQCHGAGVIIPSEGLRLPLANDCTVCRKAPGIWTSIIDPSYYACDDCFAKTGCQRLTPVKQL